MVQALVLLSVQLLLLTILLLDFIGQFVIPIKELHESKEPEQWYTLCPEGRTTPNSALGEIKLACKWS